MQSACGVSCHPRNKIPDAHSSSFLPHVSDSSDPWDSLLSLSELGVTCRASLIER